ncbi:MAG: tetratricopeptide repeat protein, partial [Fimbriimonadaceae bacterium]
MLSTLSAFVLQSIIGQVGNSERIFDLQLKGYQAMQQGRYSEALETIRKTYPLYGDESNGISGSAYLEAKALLLLGRYEEAGLAFKKGLYWTGDDFQVSGHYFETWVIGFYLPEYSEYLARVGRHEDAKLLLYCGIEQTQSFQYRFNFGGDTDTLPYTLKNVRAVCGVMKALVLESSVALGISDIDFREYLKSSINESGDWFLPWLLLANSEPNS